MQAAADDHTDCIRLRKGRNGKIWEKFSLHSETNLNHFQDQRCVLEIIFQWEVNLADILAGLGVIDVHVNHWHASILKLNHGERKETYLIKWRFVQKAEPYSCIILVLIYRCSTWVAFGSRTRTSWRFNLCTRRPSGTVGDENRSFN